MRVPLLGGLSIGRLSRAPTRSARPRSPLPPLDVAPPRPSSRISMPACRSFSRPTVTHASSASAYFAMFAQRLRDDEEGRGLDWAGKPTEPLVDVDGDRNRCALRERAHGVGETVVGQRRGVDPLRELAQLAQRAAGARLSLSARSSLPDGSTRLPSSWRPIPSASSRCWAPSSWRSRSRRRRSSSPPCTMRARDLRSSTSCALSSAWSRAFSSASPVAEPACLDERGFVRPGRGRGRRPASRSPMNSPRVAPRLAGSWSGSPVLVDPGVAVGQPDPTTSVGRQASRASAARTLPGLNTHRARQPDPTPTSTPAVSSPRPNAAAAAERPIGTYQTYRNHPLEKRLSLEHVDEDVDVLEGVHHDEHGEERYEPASRTGTGTDQPRDEHGGYEEREPRTRRSTNPAPTARGPTSRGRRRSTTAPV